MRRQVTDRLGPTLAAVSTVELLIAAEPVEASVDDALYRTLADSIVAADPAGVPLPVMAPFATDAKHLVGLGVPAYGFSPLRQDPEETYLDRLHGVDERVSVDGLRWGLPVLYDAVRRFCG
jgi:acetylornithine deacetylase/succinyl-diaminopimelate desuccinylase-like protein